MPLEKPNAFAFYRWTLSLLITAASMIFCGAAIVLAEESRVGQEPVDTPGEIPGTHGKPYEFSKDWFEYKIPHWETLLAEFKGRQGLRYLEIGVFEGRSLLWMLDNVLTHPTSTAVGVDIFFADDYEQLCRKNVEISGAGDRVTLIKETGERAMRSMPEGSFDIVYIDDGHAAWTVFAQAPLAWSLLKENGILILDDYLWEKGTRPVELRPESVVDAFLTAHAQELELLHRRGDVFARKVTRLCKAYQCSSLFDQYVYDWARRVLLSPDESREISLAVPERDMIEEILLMENADLAELRQHPTYRPLLVRLGLGR